MSKSRLIDDFKMNASEWIVKYMKGIINRELGDIEGKTIGKVFAEADSKMRRLIVYGRYKFTK
jgi:hypothetical protein